MEWKIRNFKSIDEANINLDTLKNTIIAGPNSSGKSSIIQSILLAAQSSQHNIELNGHLFSFGDPLDVIKDGTDEIIIGHNIEYRAPRRRWEPAYKIDSTIRLEEVSSGLRGSYLGVSGIELFVESNQESNHSISSVGLKGARIPNRHKSIFEKINDVHGRRLQFIPIEKEKDGFTGYIAFSGFEAVAFGYISSSNKNDDSEYHDLLKTKFISFLRKDYESMKGYISSDKDEDYREQFSYLDNPRGPFYGHQVRFIDLLDKEMSEGGNKPSFLDQENQYTTLGALYRKFSDENSSSRKEVFEYIAQKYSNGSHGAHFSVVPPHPEYASMSYMYNSFYGENLSNKIIYNKYSKKYDFILEALSAYNNSLEYLRDKVKYLGPVRNSPKAYYERSNNTYNRKNSPIGINGEYIAEYIDSIGRGNGFKIAYADPEGEKQEGTIHQAIDKWVKYVGIGEKLKVSNISKIGYSLTLEVKGRERDLTSVGVGVSQALPVIVALLTCEPGDIFLVEQPELHLHPDAQARLADFLITARPDVCVVVETHSDSILARIRRRVIENKKDDNTGLTNKNIDIIFVKPEDNGSVGEFIEMSDLGKLDRWPEGFLNGTIEDTRVIFNTERSIRKENKE